MIYRSQIPKVFESLRQYGWRIRAGSIDTLMEQPNGLVVLVRYSPYSDLNGVVLIYRRPKDYAIKAVLRTGETISWEYTRTHPLICTAVRESGRILFGELEQRFYEDDPHRDGPRKEEKFDFLASLLHDSPDRVYVPHNIHPTQ